MKPMIYCMAQYGSVYSSYIYRLNANKIEIEIRDTYLSDGVGDMFENNIES